MRERFWGRGYSGERAAAFMAVAFERLDLDLVAIDVHVENERSIRAVESYVDSFGGEREGRLRNWLAMDDRPIDCYRYTVSQDEWAANPPDVSVAFPDDG